MTATDEFVELGGVRICYRQHGPADAPALILIAGLGMQLIEWPEELISALAKDFRVVRLDNRDSGRSERCGCAFEDVPHGFSWSGSTPDLAGYDLRTMAGDVLALADHLQLQRFSCIGFSMGGMIAQLVALRAPERVMRLISISSTGGEVRLGASDEAFGLMERFFLPFATRREAEAAILDSNHYFSLGLLKRDSDENHALAKALTGRAADEGGYLRQALAMTTTGSWRRDLLDLPIPSLFLHGKDDPCIDLVSARSVAAFMPQGAFRQFAGVGHWLDTEICHEALSWLQNGTVCST